MKGFTLKGDNLREWHMTGTNFPMMSITERCLHFAGKHGVELGGVEEERGEEQCPVEVPLGCLFLTRHLLAYSSEN